MKRIKDFLTEVNYSTLGFALFSIRLAIYGASFGDAIALFAFAGIMGFDWWVKKTSVSKYNEVFEQNVKEEFIKAAQEINSIKTALGALNLGATYNRSPIGKSVMSNGPAGQR